MYACNVDRALYVGLIAVMMLVFTGKPVPAQSDPPQSSRTTITSEIMTIHNKERKAVFERNVVLTRTDLIVRSDEMVVFFEPEAKGDDQSGESTDADSQEIQKVEAFGHVVIEQKGKKAESEQAVYFSKDNKLVLTGNPVAWQEGARVSGDKMTLFLDENRSIVEGGSRVILEEE